MQHACPLRAGATPAVKAIDGYNASVLPASCMRETAQPLVPHQIGRFVQQQTAVGSMPRRVGHRRYRPTTEHALLGGSVHSLWTGPDYPAHLVRRPHQVCLDDSPVDLHRARLRRAAAQHQRLQQCAVVHSGATPLTAASRVALCVPQYYRWRRRLAGGSAWLHRIPHTKCSPKATASQSRTAYS